MKKYFKDFLFFFSYLKHRVYISFGFNVLVGLLDGLGLAMFLPLLQMVDGQTEVNSEELGGLGFLLDYFAQYGIDLTLITVLIIMALFFILKGVVVYINGWYRVVIQQYFISNLRYNGINGLTSLEYSAFLNEDVGRIQNSLTIEVERVSKAYQGYFKAIQYLAMVGVYMGFAVVVNAEFAILVALGGLVTNVLYKGIYSRTKAESRKLSSNTNDFQGLVIQFVSNYKYLKASNVINIFSKKIHDSILGLEANNKKIGVLGAIVAAAREPLVIAVVVVIIYFQTSYFGSPLAPILVSLLFFYRALTYLMMMQNEWNMYLSVSGSMENISEFNTYLFENRIKKGNHSIERFEKSILLKDVTLQLNDHIVLKNVSLNISRNEAIAFVGESGSGKSSLINVISGLLPPNEGEVEIDGWSRNSIDIGSFQKRVGYISQEPVVFDDTLYNNITLWDEFNDSNFQRFLKVIRQASLGKFYNDLPNKEHAILGNAGVNLSGGQRQRVAIARELYKDIDILIMDEATSALDSETEKDIQANIDLLKGKLTLLVIAHRLSTVKNLDKIVVLEKGAIQEVGTFNSLIQSSPSFKRMVEFQEL